jgi:hypothetical protein
MGKGYLWPMLSDKGEVDSRGTLIPQDIMQRHQRYAARWNISCRTGIKGFLCGRVWEDECGQKGRRSADFKIDFQNIVSEIREDKLWGDLPLNFC